jgi:glycosyltransferase involved in cell wall biosynthesis
MMNGTHKVPDRLPTLCRIVTVPFTFSTLLRQQLKAIGDYGIAVTLVSSPGEELVYICGLYGYRSCPISMTRRISPLNDLKALLQMINLFRKMRFDIIHSTTPKAGLLAALAGRVVRAPIRLHTFTGQPWVEMHGVPRALARWSDRLIGLLTTQCYADSASQKDFLVREGIVRPSKIAVLASGSISGVDLTRFNPKVWRETQAAITRRKLNIREDALVIVFVGRVTREKGIGELVEAFAGLEVPGRPIELVLVGPLEPDRDPLPATMLSRLANDRRIHVIGFTRQPEQYLGMADVFCLPSYREGFGTVVVEAAAMGVPAVATAIVGLVDAVIDGETGLLVPPKDPLSLRGALKRILSDSDLRRRLGQAARDRTNRCFEATVVNRAVAEEYLNLYARYQSECLPLAV